MSTLTIKIPQQLEQALAEATSETHLSKSELVRRAISAYLFQMEHETRFTSALEQAGELVGCFDSKSDDLSSNPDHLNDFGRI